MQKDAQYIEDLVAKFKRGDINPKELNELLNWYNSHLDDQVIIHTEHPLLSGEIKKRMFDGLMARVQEDNPVAIIKGRFKWPWLWIASTAAVLLLAGLWLFDKKFSGPSNQDLAQNIAADSVLPGGNKAILVMADGSQVALDTEQDGIIVDGAIRYADGQSLDKNLDLREVEDLQLYVPKGGIYQVTLADGTQVWLNSDSRLKYPSRFSGIQRLVELEGEAFFKVNTVLDDDNRHVPFIVRSKGQSIEVVGTQFNVNGYASQLFVKTTLVEGKVNVRTANSKLSLVPGQQATTEGQTTKVRRVNPQNFIAWKEGTFSFDEKSFEEIMGEIGRWYNLTIVYNGNVPDVELIGDAYRNENLSLVLQLLDASAIRYKLDIASRTLTIY